MNVESVNNLRFKIVVKVGILFVLLNGTYQRFPLNIPGILTGK